MYYHHLQLLRVKFKRPKLRLTCIGIGFGMISSSTKSVIPVTELMDKVSGTSDTLTSNLSSKRAMMLSLSLIFKLEMPDSGSSSRGLFRSCEDLRLLLLVLWLASESLRESSLFFSVWSSLSLILDRQSESDGTSAQPLDLELNFVWRTEMWIRFDSDWNVAIRAFVFRLGLFCNRCFDGTVRCKRKVECVHAFECHKPMHDRKLIIA